MGGIMRSSKGMILPKPGSKENETEEVKVTEKDKLKTYIRKKNLKEITKFLIDIIEDNYIEGITDYDKCLRYIDLCSNNEDKLIIDEFALADLIYNIYMNFEDENITYNLINMALKEDYSYRILDYMLRSRAYFTDSESWAARVYEVINDKIDRKEALNEDKMRLGIYTNISDKTMEELNKKIDEIKTHISNLKYELTQNEKYIDEKSTNIREKSEKLVENINSTFKSSISEIQNFTNESLDSIKRILNVNHSSKSEILKELEKEYNLIDAFDEKVDIKARYNKLISLKNKATIYHPKFEEVLKYFLAGNTVCLTGPSKCGKTKIARDLANLVGLSFYNLGEIHDEVSGINGYYDFNTNYNKTLFQKCFENGGVALIKNIDNAPIEVVHSLNNIISNFKYNPYVFGNKNLTTPHPNFRLIMTNNNNLKLEGADIDNLVRIDIDYDENFEISLCDDKKLLDFLHSLRKMGLNITTNTFIDMTKHIDLGLISIEDLITNYIIKNNSVDLLKRKSEEISNDNNYNNILKKVLKG